MRNSHAAHSIGESADGDVNPMKRLPLSERAQQTKQAIIEATAHILLKDGLDKVNTNYVAEKAGVSIGSLYQYYSDKEDIYEDLLTQMIAQRQARIKSALDLKALTVPVADTIAKVIDAIFEAQSAKEIQLETLLLPLLFRTGSEKKAMARAEAMEDTIKPILKTLLAVKHPKLLKRDLDVVIFVLIQSIRGVFLASGFSSARALSKEKLKQELTLLITNYLNQTKI